MSKRYVINVTDGTATKEIMEGTYNITTNTIGYSNETILPKSVTIENGTLIYNFTIEATGTLTLNVTEDGLIPIVGAKFIRCDKNGLTYGTELISDENGDIIFDNVPYDADNRIKVYYKQTASDEYHTFDNTLKNVTLNAATKTINIENPLPQQVTINLTDPNYNNLKIEASEIIMQE